MQIKLALTQRDLIDLGAEISSIDNLTILSNVVNADKSGLVVIDCIDDIYSGASVFSYLQNRTIKEIRIVQHSSTKFRVDLGCSLLIEFWRPKLIERHMNSGRLYVRDDIHGIDVSIIEEFRRWAKVVFSTTKKVLTYVPSHRVYAGVEAYRRLSIGEISIE